MILRTYVCIYTIHFAFIFLWFQTTSREKTTTQELGIKGNEWQHQLKLIKWKWYQLSRPHLDTFTMFCQLGGWETCLNLSTCKTTNWLPIMTPPTPPGVWARLTSSLKLFGAAEASLITSAFKTCEDLTIPFIKSTSPLFANSWI